MSVRVLFWIVAMAGVGFFVAGKGSYLPLGLTVSGAVLGAGAGLLLGLLFSRRYRRRHQAKSTLTRY